MRSTSPTPGPTTTPCTCCRRCGSATPGPGTRPTATPTPVAALGERRPARRARAGRRLPARRRARPGRRRAGAAVLRQRDQHRSGCTAQPPPTPYPKDGINDHVVAGAATVNPAQTGTKAAVVVPARRPGRADASSCGCGCSRPTSGDEPDAGVGRRRRSSGRSTQRRSRGRRVLRRADARRDVAGAGRGDARGVRRDGLGQAVLPLRRRRAGSTATPASRRRRPGTRTVRNARWRHLDAVRHPLDAGPVGVPVVRGLGPRLPRGRRSRTSTRRSPSTSSCCCAASGSCTPTARCRRTSGRSTT